MQRAERQSAATETDHREERARAVSVLYSFVHGGRVLLGAEAFCAGAYGQLSPTLIVNAHADI